VGRCEFDAACFNEHLAAVVADDAARDRAWLRIALKPNHPRSSASASASASSSASVVVKQHTPYLPCGGSPATGVLCEPGAVAFDAVDGDLTARVLVCPPAACLPFGCPGHEFSREGKLQSCLNTSAPVGSVFEVAFVVFNSAGGSARTRRVVSIAAPCGVGSERCESDGRCERSCRLRDTVLAAAGADAGGTAMKKLRIVR
jgi:hypothetical protein